MNDHLKGLLITALGVLLVVPDSLFVRIVEAEPFAAAFWRAGLSGLVVLCLVLGFQGTRGFREVAGTGRAGLIYVLLIGSTPPAFVLAVANTSVANVVFIFAAMPIFAAIFSRVFLGERVSRRMVLTIVVVLLGLGVIAFGSTEVAHASWKGDLFALYVAVAFSGGLTAARMVRHVSMVPAIPFAYIGSAIVLFFLSDPWSAWSGNWHLLVPWGMFIGFGTCLLSLGPRYITSAEVSLLVLLESVLAPILVWMVIGENPGAWALAGGMIVIGALLISNAIALRRKG